LSMDVHFTYSGEIDARTLKQGDILEKTGALTALIEEIHPHYANDDYTHFQVLTQSCDLVRRGSNNKCASRYISIAAVRSLSTVIQRVVGYEVDENKRIEIDGTKWCSNKHKDRVSQVIGSLFNNNDKNHFFLKAFPSHGLPEDSCTFLHLSIAIRAYEHYDLCLDAKRIELASNFQSKLGWLVGNLYSRVGTEDFVPACFENSSKFRKYIEANLNKHIAWVDAKQFSEFKSCYKDDNTLTGEQLIAAAESKLLEKHQSHLETFVNLIEKATKIEPEQKERLKNFLDSSAARRFLKM